ncbi:uncharacterized protein LOC142224565 [Haematobia irritans]|uniref:uncharacterized protein LOC142224565 n=1 Tax=Haematobia irritans TaxID=7368 RepID=UPI003F4FE1F9
MIFQGFKNTSITPESLAKKMKSLLRAYKSAKDNARRTCAGATCVPYMDELEELFGRQPTISNSNSLDVGIEQRCTPSKLSVESYENMSIEILSEDEYEYSQVVYETQLYSQPTTSKAANKIAEDEKNANETNLNKTSSVPTTKKCKLSAKDKYLEEKLRLKTESINCREEMYQKYLEEKLQIMAQRNKAVIDAIKKIDTKKLIELVAAHPHLWDRNATHYNDPYFKSSTWQSIAKVLKSPILECKARWKALRQKYRWELNFQMISTTSNTSRRKPWHLMSRMSFLKKLYKPENYK